LAPVVVDGDDDAEKNQEPILVRLQFLNQVKELRSFCRRAYKLGDLIEIQEGSWQSAQDGSKTEWTKPRMVIDVSSVEQTSQHITLQKSQFWSMTECQQWQNRFFPNKETESRPTKSKNYEATNSEDGHCESKCGGGLGKRLQGEHVAKFLIHAIMKKICDSEDGRIPTLSAEWSKFDDENHAALKKRALDYLNSGTGVIDIAGGSGHVSMALGLAGVKSTIVDARPGVGKLPGRDRKIWNRAFKKGTSRQGIEELSYCQPVVPFQAYRAWFGARPNGVDSSFRHPDEEDLPACDETSDILATASAIIALHPDEATGEIVRVAVSQKIPFVIVPCCVFCRLFPDRRKPSNNQVVSTYEDMLDYIQEQDASVQMTELPFEGKNTVLWSTF
jgi:hypothetical protein